jgi:hypothetical protein
MTFAEHLEQERHANDKSEYRAGEVFAMVGGQTAPSPWPTSTPASCLKP